jgi:transposase-like protein
MITAPSPPAVGRFGRSAPPGHSSLFSRKKSRQQVDFGSASSGHELRVVREVTRAGRVRWTGRDGRLGESALGMLTAAERMLLFVDGEDGLEPAIPGSSTDLYIFRSSRYLRYNTATHRIANGPKPVMTGFPGLVGASCGDATDNDAVAGPRTDVAAEATPPTTGTGFDVLHRDRLSLRIHDGAFSAMDLTARHPRTGELLSTVKFMVQTLAAAGELQRDLQRELTYDGLRAAEAKGNKGGRRPVVTAAKAAAVRAAYLEGQSIAALARDHHVSRGAIRTAVADLLPEHTASHEDTPAPELPVTLDMPGKVADFLRTAELEPAERDALDRGVTLRRGQGYTLRVSTTPAVHQQLLARCQPLDGTTAVPGQRKARREYANRVSPLTQ